MSPFWMDVDIMAVRVLEVKACVVERPLTLVSVEVPVVEVTNKKTYPLGVTRGLKIAFGTEYFPGKNIKELLYAAVAGMASLQTIEACTATSPETLGSHVAPKSGQLKEGYDADLIAISSNPLEDISILSEVEIMTHVWKGGKLFKSL